MTSCLGSPNCQSSSRRLKLVDLLGERSHTIFLLTNTGSFLSKPVKEWSADGDFQRFASYVCHLKVTNDAAERGIKLLSDYLQILTRDDSLRGDILQLVDNHRKKYSKGTKAEMFS